jgi:hypothetical protein
MCLAFGARSGQKVRRIGKGFGYEEELPLAKGPRCCSVNGFNIHANRYIGQQERKKLELLLAYCGRGAFSCERLSLADPNNPQGDLVFQLKSPWADGTQALILSPAEIVEKLVALIPLPNAHSKRYFGVLSSHSKWRRQIILKPHVKKGLIATPDGQSSERMTWSKLLARVFKIDVIRCKKCRAKVNPANLELVIEPALVAAILVALGLSHQPPQRAPPERHAQPTLRRRRHAAATIVWPADSRLPTIAVAAIAAICAERVVGRDWLAVLFNKVSVPR